MKWKAPATVSVIDFCTHIKILIVTFGTTIEYSTKESWVCIIPAVRAQARTAYSYGENYVSHRECYI